MDPYADVPDLIELDTEVLPPEESYGAKVKREEDVLEKLTGQSADQRIANLRRQVDILKKASARKTKQANRVRKQTLEAKASVPRRFRDVDSGLSGAASAENAIKKVLEARAALVESTAKSIARSTHRAPKSKQLPKIALPISKDKRVKKVAKQMVRDDIRAAKAKVKALEHELVAMKPKHYLPRDPVKKVMKLRKMLARAEESAARKGL